MAPTAQPTAAPTSPASNPRQRTGTTSDTWCEDWREAISDYHPPAGPDGCWASDSPRTPDDPAPTRRS